MTSDQIAITCAAPALNSSVELYDESANGTTVATKPTSSQRRITVDIFANQIVTVFHEILLPGSATWRIVNTGGDATTASTLFDKDYYFRAGLNRIRIAATTAPTTWEAAGRLMEGRVSPT